MNSLLLLILAAALIVALVLFLTKGIRPGHRSPITKLFANIAEGTHPGLITKFADGAYGRHLLVKTGSDADHVALAGVADIPIGIIDDESDAAEAPVNVQLLGSTPKTILAQASAAIAKDAFVSGAANGQIRTLPGTTGTYYIIGRAMNAAGAAGDLVEIDPVNNVQRVVP